MSKWWNSFWISMSIIMSVYSICITNNEQFYLHDIYTYYEFIRFHDSYTNYESVHFRDIHYDFNSIYLCDPYTDNDSFHKCIGKCKYNTVSFIHSPVWTNSRS